MITAIVTENLSSRKILHSEISRKILHFTSSISAGLSVFITEDKFLLITIGIAASIITYFLIKLDIFKSIHNERAKSWGIFYLPLAYTLMILFLFPANETAIFSSMLILGVADSLAAAVGSFKANKYYKLTGDQKSLVGSVTFFLSTFMIIVLFSSTQFLNNILLIDIVLVAFTSGLLLTAIEAISSKGIDNLTVPLFASILFLVVNENFSQEFILNLFLGVILAGMVAVVSIKYKFLTLSGSVATFILAGFIFGFGGWKWSIPIMTFFILSSLLSKVRKKTNENVESYFEKSGTRDYLQVFANGGLGGLLVIYNQFSYSDLNYYIYLASLAAVCADTWATEIGTLRKRITYNILNFKKTEQGISGGISLVGTFGAFLGSLVIALSGFFWIDLNWLHYFLLMIAAGLFGSFFDSFLGATFQSQGQCSVCSKITEKEFHCGAVTTHYRGVKWLNNDAVNFLAGASSAIFILLIF